MRQDVACSLMESSFGSCWIVLTYGIYERIFGIVESVENASKILNIYK